MPNRRSPANRGKYWEGVLVNSWPLVPECDVEKFDPQFQVTDKRGARFEGFWKAKGVCDFEGGYRGLAVSAEAKQVTNAARFPFSMIQDHQMERLKGKYLQGGLAGLLVCWVDKYDVPMLAVGISYLGLLELMSGKFKSAHFDDVVELVNHSNGEKAVALRWTVNGINEAVHLTRFMEMLERNRKVRDA